MILLHQAPSRRNGIEPSEKRLSATGDLIDSEPFEGLVDYSLNWPDLRWPQVRLATC